MGRLRQSGGMTHTEMTEPHSECICSSLLVLCSLVSSIRSNLKAVVTCLEVLFISSDCLYTFWHRTESGNTEITVREPVLAGISDPAGSFERSISYKENSIIMRFPGPVSRGLDKLWISIQGFWVLPVKGILRLVVLSLLRYLPILFVLEF